MKKKGFIHARTNERGKSTSVIVLCYSITDVLTHHHLRGLLRSWQMSNNRGSAFQKPTAIHAAILLLLRSPNMANVLYEYLHLISGNPVDIKSEGEKKTPWPQNSFRKRCFAFLNVFVSSRSFSLTPFKSKPEIRIFRLKHASLWYIFQMGPP